MSINNTQERDYDYENNNLVYDEYCEEKEGIKCKNYELCETALPKWWWDCKCRYLCTNCHMLFGSWDWSKDDILVKGKGILEFKDNIECPICYETKKGISQPRCDHYVCIDCFKRLHYGPPSPRFPYPDIEEEYCDDEDNPKWEKYRPLIKKYDKDYDDWEANQACRNEKNLELCPICRS